MPSIEYKEAPEVAAIADRFILKHHPRLVGFTVRYVMRSEAAQSRGKAVWGKARKVTGLNAHLAGEDDTFFVIEIAANIWIALDKKQQEALVDHCLCQMDYNDEQDGPTIKGPDVEEFKEIIERHGFWRDSLKEFGQIALPFAEQLQSRGKKKTATVKDLGTVHQLSPAT